uniref:NADH-ubiquinone oxidoreductase chain 6 n=1 Tax=Staphylinidae sp. BMNH 1274171 TaxID=1796552 RepID=A0A140EGN4_9COLE|nr:NADH dehydrogenase subunit 6 [Staphylinidae sp. BMNH 1274171]
MMFLMLNCIFSIMFILMNHPMSLGMILLTQTILISMITGYLSMNFWFSYILFLIMIGGMLILFIYMTSIASNEPFYFSKKMLFNYVLLMIIIIIMIMVMDPYYFLKYLMLKENLWLNNLDNYNLTKYFNYPSIIIIIMMMIYLLITLIAIVKITQIEYGPLRQKF